MLSHEEINELLNAPEGTKLEFKEKVDLSESYAKTDFLYHLLALVNSPGGTAHLIIGVNDKTREVIGTNDSTGLNDENLQTLVREYISPALSIQFEKIEFEDHFLGIVTIPPSGLKPHYFNKEMRGALPNGKQFSRPAKRIFTRSGSTTQEATSDEIVMMSEEANVIRGQSSYQVEELSHVEKVTIPITFSPPPRSRGFIGREDELKRLEKELSKTPVVLIEGLPGIGKTSLAAQFISQHTNGNYENVYWLDCQEDTNLENLIAAFLDYGKQAKNTALIRAVDVDRPLSDRIHRIIEVLDSHSSFLVLDVFERADIASLQIFVQEVLEHSDHLKVIICTRERPQAFMNILADISEIQIEGLIAKDAVVLLIKHTNILEDPDILYKVAQKTEGHPLAIRLFIPLVRDYQLSPEELLADAPEFGQSLEEHWLLEIHNRLLEEERSLFEFFSVYLEPVSREGIQAVAVNKEIRIHLRSLQDKFLLNKANNVFSTHSLIREFFNKRLVDKGLLQETAERAAGFYLNRISINEYDKDTDDLDVVNKLRAHHYCFLAGKYFLSAKIVHNLKSTLIQRGEHSQLLGLIEKTFETMKDECLNSSQRQEWSRISAWLEYYQGRIYFIRGQLSASQPIFEKLAKSSDKDLRSESIQMLANIYLAQGKPQEVIRLFENNIKIYRNREKKLERVFDKVARAYIQIGAVEKALEIYKQLLGWQDADKDTIGGAITLRQLAILELDKGNIENAHNLAMASETLSKGNGDPYQYGWITTTMGDIHIRKSNTIAAIEWYEIALKSFIQIENRSAICDVGEKLLNLYLAAENHTQYQRIQLLLTAQVDSPR